MLLWEEREFCCIIFPYSTTTITTITTKAHTKYNHIDLHFYPKQQIVIKFGIENKFKNVEEISIQC